MFMITKNKYRISVLTDRLLRLEYQEEGRFVDLPTQAVVSRDFPEVETRIREEGEGLVLETPALLLRYDGEPFSPTGLSVTLKENGAVWNYSIIYGNTDENLLGTARTLDVTDGHVVLEPGIFGKRGYAVLDDSHSPVLRDGEFRPREAEGLDLYLFGYGKDYAGGLRDFFALCGKTPMIPRYALGNWWSRYYAYTEESYLELLDRFEEENIPLSVAVIDMDWHVTEVPAKYGTGWTGYTWNRELFPDYVRFLKKLKERKLRTTLNLHPADGIRAFEEAYPRMAGRMGIDPDSEKAVEFDFSSPKFREAYFEEILHPYEEDGVDFWWIDWQQGTGKAADVDPLLLLNHFHYTDQENRNVRPMIFSRYAGPGSHRYPIGFSGDTFTTWQSLRFQPYFTSTASNIGYGWWSHDLGGHMLGNKDLERLTRWIQFGVFSPITRIHSSNSPFLNKEPWTLEEPYRGIVGDFLRLRQQMVPYLYTMMYLAFKEDRPLVQPMYYVSPEDEGAFEVIGEYGFGTSLLVGAITEPMDPVTRMAAVNVLIPEGTWYDIQSGRIYRGRQMRKLYRPLAGYPVLLGAGRFVPMSGDEPGNGTENPAALRLLAGFGEDGSFVLYEDDGLTMAYREGAAVRTRFSISAVKARKEARIKIGAADGDLSLIPAERSYEIVLYGVSLAEGSGLSVAAGGVTEAVRFKYDEKRRILRVRLPKRSVRTEQEIRIEGIAEAENDYAREVFAVIDRAWIENTQKDQLWEAYEKCGSPAGFLRRLEMMDVDERLKDALREVFAGLPRA